MCRATPPTPCVIPRGVTQIAWPGLLSPEDGCGDTVCYTLTCRTHALTRAARECSTLTALSAWTPGSVLGAAPTPDAVRYGAPVPSRGDDTSRALIRPERTCSMPASAARFRTTLRCFSKVCRESILVNRSAGFISPGI